MFNVERKLTKTQNALINDDTDQNTPEDGNKVSVHIWMYFTGPEISSRGDKFGSVSIPVPFDLVSSDLQWSYSFHYHRQGNGGG